MNNRLPSVPRPRKARPARRSAPATIKITGIQGNIPSFGSPGTNEVAWRKQLRSAFGTSSDDFIEMALHQLVFAARLNGGGPCETAINGAITMIAAATPSNAIEAALAVQMAATHMTALAMMARIGGAHGGAQRLPGLASAAAKLLRAYFGQVETLRRLRGGGEQTITVQHVTLNNQGGQAIVGGVISRPKGE